MPFVLNSQEIADGVSKSTQAVQAAEAGIRQFGTLARQQTMCMFKAMSVCDNDFSFANLFLLRACHLLVEP